MLSKQLKRMYILGRISANELVRNERKSGFSVARKRHVDAKGVRR